MLTAFSMKANATSFFAYNDLASSVLDEYVGTNITDHSLGDTSELLTDYATGSQPGYTLSVIGDPNGDANVSGTTTNGANPNPGTDAYSVFEDEVNMVRYIQGASGAGFVDLVFDGLTQAELYEVVVYGERSPATDGRPTQFTILGSDDFINDSTFGSEFTDSSDPSVSFNTAPNFDLGYVARFTSIDPGSDGTFSVRVDQTLGSSQNWYVNALSFRVLPTSVPEPSSLVALVMISSSLLLSKRLK
jgi:hypothetical protein